MTTSLRSRARRLPEGGERQQESTNVKERGFSLQQLNQFQEVMLNVIDKLSPVFKSVEGAVDQVWPQVEPLYQSGKKFWDSLSPYNPEDKIQVVLGLLMMCFGGHFVTTLAAVEAFRLVAWEDTKDAFMVVKKNYDMAQVASKKDDLLDEDNDGVADVKQITHKELVRRKLHVAAKSINPAELQLALRSILAGFFAVAATVKVQFARSITLGNSIGSLAESGMTQILSPVLAKTVPSEHRKWIPVIVSTIARGIGVMLAWMLQRVISAVHSAARGSHMFATGLRNIAVRNNIVDASKVKDGELVFTAGSAMLALSGLLWQLRSGFALPFPLNIILLPFTLFEWFFTLFVSLIS